LPHITNEYKSGTYETINLTCLQFFNAIRTTPPYHYFAATADSLGDAYHDLYPIEPLMVKNSSWKADESYLHRWTNAWLGPAGATTHTHYDITHNFYAQIVGVKRFVLFPPEDFVNLYLFPFLHPGAQQSQVDFENPDLKEFPSFKYARAIEAILQPGDVLYLPPLWFHHVSALSLSMSVSVWTKFPETQTMYQTVRSVLPFQRDWPRSRMLFAGKIYLEMLIDMLDNKTGAAVQFVQQLLDTRYAHLINTVPNFLRSKSEVSFCDIDLLPETRSDLLRNFAIDFEVVIAKQVKLFRQAHSLARRNIWLGNLVEQIALTLAGVEHVANFLRDFVAC